ncbi:MAG: potassium channel family protein, partial [Mobilitalea sp.]
LLLSLMVWIVTNLNRNSFKNIKTFFDAFYFTIVSFSTVGYGEMYAQSILAKVVVIVIILSNILLLIIFVNFFIMRSQKKNTYLHDLILNIYFMFSQLASCCGIIDNTYKEEEHTWPEWINIYNSILQSVLESNSERVKEISDLIFEDRQFNSKLEPGKYIREIPYRYINNKDSFLVQEFVDHSKKIINAIQIIEGNKFNLLENENLSIENFYILSEIKDGIDIASKSYRYGLKDGISMTIAWKGDLINQLERLGYSDLTRVKFRAYDINDNIELTCALNNIDIHNHGERFRLKVESMVNHILKF